MCIHEKATAIALRMSPVVDTGQPSCGRKSLRHVMPAKQSQKGTPINYPHKQSQGLQICGIPHSWLPFQINRGSRRSEGKDKMPQGIQGLQAARVYQQLTSCKQKLRVSNTDLLHVANVPAVWQFLAATACLHLERGVPRRGGTSTQYKMQSERIDTCKLNAGCSAVSAPPICLGAGAPSGPRGIRVELHVNHLRVRGGWRCSWVWKGCC